MRNKIFSSTLLFLFILGLGILLLPQKEESALENRKLYTNKDISLNNDFIIREEEILKDQFYYRDDISKNYYQIRINLNKGIDFILKKAKTLYFNLKSNKTDIKQNDLNISDLEMLYLSDEVIEINDGYLINMYLKYDEDELILAGERGYNINQFALKYPDIKTYIYFPTRMEEMINPENKNHLYAREIFIKQLNDNISYASLNIKDIKDHQKYFYKSDSHLNHLGAYQTYQDIIMMISNDYDIDKPKEIENEISLLYKWKGNISAKIGDYGLEDNIGDYILKDLGEYDYYIDDEYIKDPFKDKNDYIDYGNSTKLSDYDYYFGLNYFKRLYDFHNEDKPNLLIFGDSYININKSWIASHFNKTLIVDLRSKDENFNLEELLSEFKTDIVLISYSYEDMYFNGNLYFDLNK